MLTLKQKILLFVLIQIGILFSQIGLNTAYGQYFPPGEPIQPPNDPANRWIQTAGPQTGADLRIEIDSHSGAIYAGGLGGMLYKSTDGQIWNETTVMAERFRIIGEILVDPVSPDTVWVLIEPTIDLPGSVGEVYRSTDGAQSWTEMTWENIEGDGAHKIAISPTVAGSIIIGTFDGRIFITEDGSASTLISRPLPGPGPTPDDPPPYIRSVAAGAAGEFWVSTSWSDTLFHTIDSGVNWQSVATLPGNQLPPEPKLIDIMVDPKDTRRVYVALEGDSATPERANIIRTDDGGATWHDISISNFGGYIRLAAIDPSSDILYLTGGMLIWQTSDHGSTWTMLLDHTAERDKIKYVDPLDIAIDPRDSNILYLPTGGFGIAKSTDGGGTWDYINHGLSASEVSLVAALGEPAGGVICNGDRSLFRTYDWGQTWEKLTPSTLGVQFDEIAVDPQDPNRIWVATDQGEMHVSNDGGDTFTSIFKVMPPSTGFRYGSVYAMVNAQAAEQNEPDRLYVVKAGFGIWRSDDGGNIWKFLKNSEVDYTYTLAVDPTNPDILFAGHNPKPFEKEVRMFRTMDGGDTWDTPLILSDASAITSIAIDPGQTSNVYAGIAGDTGGRIFQSSDGGDSWNPISNLSFANIHAMATHPDDPAYAIAALWGGGLYFTVNSGQRWDMFPEPPTVSASAVMITPSDPPVFYIADRSSPRIYKAHGHGPMPTWETFFDAGPSYYRVVTGQVAPSAPFMVYASIFDYNGPMNGSIFRIEAGMGVDVTGTLPTIPIALAVHPTDPTIVYACLHGAGSGVYKTTNAGGTWDLLTGPGSGIPQSPAIGFNGVTIDTSNPQTLYLFGGSDARFAQGRIITTGANTATLHTIYRSTDGGSTWTNLNDGNLGANSGAIKGVAILPTNPRVLFAGAIEGVFQSKDGGDTWAKADTGMTYRHMGGIGISSNGVTLYGPTLGGGMHTANVDSTMHKPNWNSGSNLRAPVYNVQVAVHPTNSNVLFASAYPGGLFKSTDSGLSWREHNFGLPTLEVDDPTRQGYYTFAISPSNPDVMYLGIYGRGIYISEDGGATWLARYGANRTIAGAPIASLLIDDANPNHVWAATENGVYVTENGGRNWSILNDGLTNSDVRLLVMESDGDLLAGTRGNELYRYGPMSNEWEQMPALGDLGNPWLVWNRGVYQYTSILFHPQDQMIVYIGTFPTGIYKSEDSGQTWRERNIGFTNDGIFYITCHPDNPAIIYAGTYNGVNRTTDAGNHWHVWDKGWPDEQWVFDIEFDPRNPDIMYACSKNGENKGNGREDFHGTVMKSTNGGDFWYEIINGLSDQEFYGLVIDPDNPDILYLAGQKGVFITRNAGENWQPFSDGLTNPMASHPNNVTCPLAISNDGKYLFLGSMGSGLYRLRLRL